jgi:hypothetical protein
MQIEFAGKSLKIARELSLDNSFTYETSPLRCESSMGEGYLVLSFEATFGFEYQVRIACGYQSFAGQPLGGPISHDGEEIGYFLTGTISVDTVGTPSVHDLKCVMQKAKMEGRGPIGLKPLYQNPDLERRLVEAWTPTVAGLISENAAAVEKARRICIGIYVAEINKDVTRTWASLRSMIDHRDAVRHAMHDPTFRPSRVEQPGAPSSFELREFETADEYGRGLDEIVATGITMLHAETMSDDGLWIGATLVDGRRLAINVTGKGLEMRAEIDDDPSADV